jgi:hypothetical protein
MGSWETRSDEGMVETSGSYIENPKCIYIPLKIAPVIQEDQLIGFRNPFGKKLFG